MHLWIAATIAFCCVIFTETQAQLDAPVGAWKRDDIRDLKIEKLAEEALEKIKEHLDDTNLAIYVIHPPMVGGEETVLLVEVVPTKCKESRAPGCGKRNTCEVSIKNGKKPKINIEWCDPFA